MTSDGVAATPAASGTVVFAESVPRISVFVVVVSARTTPAILFVAGSYPSSAKSLRSVADCTTPPIAATFTGISVVSAGYNTIGVVFAPVVVVFIIRATVSAFISVCVRSR